MTVGGPSRRVLITGASGFVGRHAARGFRERGLHVAGVARGSCDEPAFARVHVATLGESLEPALRAEAPDVVLHAAYDPTPDAPNLEGTRRWFEEALDSGVGLQILLSSRSAAPDAAAAYGRDKHALEELFRDAGQVSYRLGLVVGDGGMFARIERSVRRTPVVPLLDGGTTGVWVLGIDGLVRVLTECILDDGAGRRGRVIRAWQPERHTLRELLLAICRARGYRRWLLAVPSLPVLWVAETLERLPLIRLPVSVTNLRGLRQGRNDTAESDFAELGIPSSGLDSLIAKAARAAPPAPD